MALVLHFLAVVDDLRGRAETLVVGVLDHIAHVNILPQVAVAGSEVEDAFCPWCRQETNNDHQSAAAMS